MKKIWIFIVVALIAAAVAWLGFSRDTEPTPTTAESFEECVAQGNPVMESYPRQCRDQAGALFVEDVTRDWEAAYTNASEDLIVVNSPEVGDSVSSPLTISGEARGYWFFEATFPIVIVDWDGRIIAEHYAEAEGDWMTEEFVPFTATLEFDTPTAGALINRGAIILQRSNASGLPENDAALEIPIVFE
ncbi:MAG: Gmad2 immunoglobulin-like domain-containing protein [Patescibacteria group bacterium UBA2163]